MLTKASHPNLLPKSAGIHTCAAMLIVFNVSVINLVFNGNLMALQALHLVMTLLFYSSFSHTVNLSIYLFIYLSVCLPVCLSVCLCICLYNLSIGH
jgi:hypothetical protein